MEELRKVAVVCAKGHEHSTYPESGLCQSCGIFLPENQASALAAGTRREITRAQLDVAERLLDDEGVVWKEAPEVLRQLAQSYAKTQNIKTLEMMLSQIGTLKARPRPSVPEVEAAYVVNLTADTVDNLERSLDVLGELLSRATPLPPEPD